MLEKEEHRMELGSRPTWNLGSRKDINSDRGSPIYEAREKQRKFVKRFLLEEEIDPHPFLVDAYSGIIDTVPSSVRDDGEVLEDLLRETVEGLHLKKVNELEGYLVKDASAILRKDRGKVKSYDVLQTLWEKSPRLYSNEIAIVVKNSGYQDKVTVVLRKLSLDNDHILWTRFPVVEEHSDGWKTTPYGELLSYLIFEKNHKTAWLYETVFYPLVEDMEGEIGTPNHVDRISLLVDVLDEIGYSDVEIEL